MIEASLVEQAGPHIEAPSPASRRLLDTVDHRIVNALTALGFGLPVALYFWTIRSDGVNVIYQDELSNVSLIKASYSHFIPWEELWSPWGVHRMLFPNLIVIALAHSTHFNVTVEDSLSGFMLLVATALLIWTHKRRSPDNPWLYYCPVALLTFSLVQYYNALFGFQMAWYLILLALAVTLFLLDRVELTWIPLMGAIIAGFVGSFSSLEGLIIWPVGLVLLYHRRRSALAGITWIAAGVASAVVYFHNLPGGAGASPGYIWHHLGASVSFYLLLIGDVVGNRLTRHLHINGSNVEFFGFVVLVIAVAVLIAYGIRRDTRGGSPIGVALICFGLLFAAFVTEGRITYGLSEASDSRYTTFDLLILVGIYLALLGKPTLFAEDPQIRERAVVEQRSVAGRWQIPGNPSGSATGLGLLVVRCVVIGLISVQILLGFSNGRVGDTYMHKAQVEAVAVSRNVNHTADGRVLYFLGDSGYWRPVSYIRQQIDTADRLHLSLFSESPTSRP